jgi:hypothetical protein
MIVSTRVSAYSVLATVKAHLLFWEKVDMLLTEQGGGM